MEAADEIERLRAEITLWEHRFDALASAWNWLLEMKKNES